MGGSVRAAIDKCHQEALCFCRLHIDFVVCGLTLMQVHGYVLHIEAVVDTREMTPGRHVFIQE